MHANKNSIYICAIHEWGASFIHLLKKKKRETLLSLNVKIHAHPVHSQMPHENIRLLFSALYRLSDIVLIPAFSRIAVYHMTARFLVFNLGLTVEDGHCVL